MKDEIKNNMAKVVSVLDEMVKWSKQKNLEYKQEKEQVLKSINLLKFNIIGVVEMKKVFRLIVFLILLVVIGLGIYLLYKSPNIGI